MLLLLLRKRLPSIIPRKIFLDVRIERETLVISSSPSSVRIIPSSHPALSRPFSSSRPANNNNNKIMTDKDTTTTNTNNAGSSCAQQSCLPEHFAKYPGDSYLEGWAELWNKGDNLPWDRGVPSPALEETLVRGRALLGGPFVIPTTEEQQERRRKKALVPGCGRGVDVLLLASFGYDAYGLECSAAALEACRQEEAKSEEKYPVRDPEVGRGKVTWVQGDFFKDDWLEKLGLGRNSFHLIYDYTVCTTVPILSISSSSVPFILLSTLLYSTLFLSTFCDLFVFERDSNSDSILLPFFGLLPGGI